MQVRWTGPASADLRRLYDFLAPLAPAAAVRAINDLVSAADHLRDSPRLGRRVGDDPQREMRRIFVGHYELRYEIRQDSIFVVRIWHTREDRGR